MKQSSRDSFNTYFLFAAVIIVWALSWPITKIGLTYMPSYWYTLARSLAGCVALFAILWWKNVLSLPKKEDVPIVLSIGILEIGVALPLVAVGLSYIETARSALLLYTIPFWSAPIAYFMFKEKISQLKLIGLLSGLVGFMVLFNPSSFDWSDKNVLIGNGCVVSAAILWAIVMLHTRYGKWVSQPLVLLPWQLMIGSAITLACALIVEPNPHVEWNYPLISSLAYNSFLACAFGYFASITVTRRLPVVSTSLGFLGVPIFGILSSTIIFHGHFALSFLAASAFILLGLVIVAVEPKFTTSEVAT